MGAQVRPADLPTGYACGTNAAYVNGCHCDRCKAAHREQARDRQRRVEEAAAEVQPNPEVPRKVIVKAGVEHLVRACPGCNGKPCVKGGAWLRVGEVCRACVDRAVVWNGLVDAGPARAHLLALSEQQVGKRAVSAACDVALSVLDLIRRGTKTQIRAQTERRILAVDASAISDGARVPAKPVRKLLRRLQREEDMTKGAIALRLGSKVPALQVGNTRWVTARTAAKVAKLVRAELGDGEQEPVQRGLTPDAVRRLVEAAEEGVEMGDLVERFGLSAEAISQRLRRARREEAA